ncbi:N-acyl-D-amino-acid deacylase family protein [Sphingobium agri]|uniref:Amidohydrolase family protein n=1 Tax=Sphingobium agri TaxID=2933566 RepID=A0ABT0E0N3_9SPHN|nr:amidohydrolase family protein [Sphingobium agri]MCK0532918.1 amidohydrolase family protein [Sphingobium agri]
MSACDLLIRGGTIIDGSGGEPFVGDVAIADGRIVSVGTFTGDAREVIDAAALTVTPGFVDIHTHYDGQAIWSEELSPSSSHGVTTVVIGNCGVGFAPCRPADHDRLIRLMEGVEDIPGVVMAEGLSWDWESFPDYLNALEARPRDIDVAALLPHSPLRVFVMGERGAQREPATPADLEKMQALTREALDAGAIGFATSRLLIHRTKAGENIPSYQADVEELKAIAGAMRNADTGVLQMVLDAPFSSWTDELSHLLTVAKAANRPATFTLGTSNTGEPVWQEALRICEEANAQGLKISPQILPRPVGMICGFELSSHPFSLCPSYEAIAALPLDQQLTHLRDAEFRARLITEKPHEGHPLAMMTRNWDWIFPLSDPPNYEPPAESSVGAQARRLGITPEEVAYDLMMNGGDGRGMLYNTLGNFYNGRLDTVHDLITHPDTVMGLGDGGAHYAAICDASYPTFLLTYWTRDRAGPKLSIPQAVRALTSRPAETMGLRDRGRIAPGYKADINIIDLEALHLHAPHVRHDLPGGGRRLDQKATGFVATIVSGDVIRRSDGATGARPGRLVRGAQNSPD